MRATLHSGRGSSACSSPPSAPHPTPSSPILPHPPSLPYPTPPYPTPPHPTFPSYPMPPIACHPTPCWPLSLPPTPHAGSPYHVPDPTQARSISISRFSASNLSLDISRVASIARYAEHSSRPSCALCAFKVNGAQPLRMGRDGVGWSRGGVGGGDVRWGSAVGWGGMRRDELGWGGVG